MDVKGPEGRNCPAGDVSYEDKLKCFLQKADSKLADNRYHVDWCKGGRECFYLIYFYKGMIPMQMQIQWKMKFNLELIHEND